MCPVCRGTDSAGAAICSDDRNCNRARPRMGGRRARAEVVAKHSVVFLDCGEYATDGAKFVVRSHQGWPRRPGNSGSHAMADVRTASLETTAPRSPLGGAVRPTGLWLRGLGLDRAAAYAILSRIFLLASAPVTLFLIARSFTPELQGYYYTFASLVALQSFIELGFYLVVINLASHEWSALALDDGGRIVGDPRALSRLVSLGRLIFKWYAAASTVFVVVVGLFGWVFFSGSPDSGVHWQGPWLALVGLTGLLLWALPFNSLLEGCDQVATVNRFRLSQAVLANLALWATVALGGGLWASVVWALVSVLRDVYLLVVRYGRFFEPFRYPPTGPRIHWGSEVWPLQWRLGVSGMSNYFGVSLYSPVLFYSHGAAAAGRMGMTVAAVFGVQSVATAWLQTRAPRFGILIARREYAELDRLFLRVSCASTCLFVAGASALWVLVFGLNVIGHPLADRLLTPLPTGVFLLGALFHQASVCMAVYLRAHKQEPLALLSVVANITIGLLVWLAGSRYGPIGAAASYTGVYAVAATVITVIWSRCRALWHSH